MKNIFRPIFPALALLCTASCSENYSSENPDTPHNSKVQVRIGAAQATTRTSLDEDGITTRWSVGDRIAVWAASGNGFTFAAEPFELYTYNSLYSSADFSATIDPMTQGSYTYYAVYPQPAAVNGTTVSYEIPAIQSGSYQGACDIMIAKPVTGAALSVNPRDELALTFRHLLHMVRIEIPSGRNLSGGAVKRIEAIFPSEVTGTVTFDATDPEAVPAISGGSNTLIFDLPGSGTEGGDGTYLYAFIRPCDMDGEVVFRAYNTEGYASKEVRTTLSKTMAAGRATPIALTIPTPRPVTYLDFKTATNNLGEEVTDIHLTAPEGTPFAVPFSWDGSANISAKANAEGICRVLMYADATPASAVEGKTCTIDYESENALLTGKSITLPGTLTAESSNSVSMNVPYLFEEDFSGVTSTESSDAQDLSGFNLPGWSGSRYSLQANTSARIWGYLGSSIVSDPDSGDNHRGRLDTSILTCIKEGKSVSLNVSYTVGGTKVVGTFNGTVMYSKYSFGTDTKTGPIKGDGIEIENILFTEEPGTDGSYTNTPNQRTVTCPTVTNKHRLSWRASFNVVKSGWSTITAGSAYVYIDNIKVKIEK